MILQLFCLARGQEVAHLSVSRPTAMKQRLTLLYVVPSLTNTRRLSVTIIARYSDCNGGTTGRRPLSDLLGISGRNLSTKFPTGRVLLSLCWCLDCRCYMFHAFLAVHKI